MADHADLRVAFLDDVALEILGELTQPVELLFQFRAAETGVDRNGVLAGLARERLARRLDPHAGLDEAASVGEAGRRAEHDGCAEALAQLEGGLDHVSGFGGVAGLEHRHLRDLGEVAAVLLVLGRVHARVVGDQHHEAGVRSGVGEDHERVGGHVQPHMFHRDKRAYAAERGADPLVERHLLVGGPVRVDLFVVGQPLQHLGAGRSRIAGGEPDAGLPGAPGDGLVSRHQASHTASPFE